MATMIVSELWLQHQQEQDFHNSHAAGKRLSTPKVKTGCRGCKASHLKCDEQKPSCARCQKRGTTCHYQPTPHLNKGTAPRRTARNTRPAKPSPVTNKATQPRILQPAALTHAHHRARPSHLSPHPPSTTIRPWEAQYFDSFRYLVVPHLHYQQSEFWCRTVLRESLRDECVRNAMLALGALGRVQAQQWNISVPLYKSQVGLLAKEGSTGRTVLNHYYQALVHYAKAINAFRRLLTEAQDKKHTPRSILIATVLLSQFELLQGNTDAADQIAARSVSLLGNRIMRGIVVPAPTTTSDDDVDSMSLIAAAIDDEGVWEAGTELVLKTILNAACSALYPKAREVILALNLPVPNSATPPSPEETSESFVLLWKRCLAVVCVWYFRLQARMLITQQQQQQQDGVISTPGNAAFDVYPFVVAHRHEQRALLDLVASWQVAVRARLAACKTPGPAATATSYSNAYIAYSKAAVAIHATCYSLRTAFDITGKSWDPDDDSSHNHHHESSTRELLDQCEAVVDMVSEQLRLSSSATAAATSLRDQGVAYDGVMSAVMQIAHQARHRGFRARAMDIWGRMLGGDAHWNVLATYLAAVAVHDVEEEFRDPVTGEIPVDKQYMWVEGSWDEAYTHFRAVVVGKVPGVDGVSDRRIVMVAAPWKVA
ncbi:uncharacterized protein B0I36DRAFT_123062 [Microdochium trichocladiopsis]|uniref:Zn(2)-C6 fungal-type domain-containing protein n=1 Tax=Microdochium trichocladiopsis TaxID=1682393 RepID=A0A9P8Y728_9PEZI|nr:uncharacterized protein B0I36DRAFT_123062 [Microdochium trichocladiopsis]KAH7031464.1 hypothetical protein B0I36DRAFT_123062 [Microdochium trichocladiopsis]